MRPEFRSGVADVKNAPLLEIGAFFTDRKSGMQAQPKLILESFSV